MPSNDENLFRVIKTGSGKRDHQKIKPYIVLQYLLEHSDEAHVVTAPQLVAELQDMMGIDAERRSIYRDIDEINKALWMLDNETDIQEAAKVIDADEDNLEKFIVYDKKQKGFYVRQRKYEVDDIRLLAESIYASKFLTKNQADNLVDVVCGFVSEYQRENIKHDTFLVDRVRTNNKSVLYNIGTLNEAMRKGTKAAPHIPEKVSFKYLKYSINDVSQQAERRKGNVYVVSPFMLLINDGNYYLLAYSEKYQEMRTYRVDRMKDVTPTGEVREGEDVFLKMDLKSYTQRVFGMFGGERKGITLRFINPLLDTVIDRFGTKGVSYTKADDSHFYITADVEISDQFFGWLCGFGKKVKIIGPESVESAFKAYLDKIREMY